MYMYVLTVIIIIYLADLKDTLSFVRLGIILVYSTQRPASLAVAKALLPKLPNLPKLIIAMAMDESHDNKLLEEGQSLADESNAVFVYNNGKALPSNYKDIYIYIYMYMHTCIQ